MSKNIDSIAIHEAGHAFANILIANKFKYVTIKEETEKDEFGSISLGLNSMTIPDLKKNGIR